MLLYVHRDHIKDCYGRGAGLRRATSTDFHTALFLQCCGFMRTEMMMVRTDDGRSTFIARDSINLYAQCAQGGGRGVDSHENKDTWCKVTSVTKQVRLEKLKKALKPKIINTSLYLHFFLLLFSVSSSSSFLLCCCCCCCCRFCFCFFSSIFCLFCFSFSFGVCFSAAFGIRRRGYDDERRGRAGTYWGMSSCKYSGAVLS